MYKTLNTVHTKKAKYFCNTESVYGRSMAIPGPNKKANYLI